MVSKTTSPATNGAGRRKLDSWIESFIKHTDNLDIPLLFRKWSAITTIAATLEQKVSLKSSEPLYPNLYVFLVGHPGTGKTRSIRAAKKYAQEIQDFHFAPTSMTAASMVDAMLSHKRFIARLPDPPLEYNNMMITADELSTFMHKFDDEIIGVLSSFYDTDPYSQERRTKELKVKIKSPQLTILAGTTPSNLLKFMPENAWDQGFTSRIIMVFSDERIIGDDFATIDRPLSADLIHDLKLINTLCGEYSVTEDYRAAVSNWRNLGEPPLPNHPKLLHYNTRRKTHLYKLSVVAAVDRSAQPLLTKDDFNRAMGWLLEAEAQMPDIFKAGAPGSDSKAMDEILHFVIVNDRGKGVAEKAMINFARDRVSAYSLDRVIRTMESSGLIEAFAIEKLTGLRRWRAVQKE